MSEIRIPLTRPVPGHHGDVRELVLREPTFNDFMDLGDPYQIAQSPEGSNFAIVDPEVVRGYFERMLIEPKHPELLTNASIKDAQAVQAAILRFFQDGGGDSAT